MSVIKRQKVWGVVWGTYLLCYAFRILEYFVLRTDQTLVGEAIVHKLMGIGVLFAVTAWRKLTITQIGFVREKVFGNLLKGLAFGCGVFVLDGSFVFPDLYCRKYSKCCNGGRCIPRTFREAVEAKIHLCCIGACFFVLLWLLAYDRSYPKLFG